MTHTNNARLDKLVGVTASWFPTIKPEKQRAGIRLLRGMSQRRRSTSARFAQALAIADTSAEALARRSGLSPYVHSGEGDEIRGFMGLTVSRTAHQMTVNGRRLWTWCAYDTLFLPTLLGETGAIGRASCRERVCQYV